LVDAERIPVNPLRTDLFKLDPARMKEHRLPRLRLICDEAVFPVDCNDTKCIVTFRTNQTFVQKPGLARE